MRRLLSARKKKQSNTNDTQSKQSSTSPQGSCIFRTVLIVSRPRLHGDFVTGRLQCPEVRKGIPAEALRKSPVSHGPEFRHVDVDPGTSPSRDAQRFAAVRIVVNDGADAIDIIESLQKQKSCNLISVHYCHVRRFKKHKKEPDEQTKESIVSIFPMSSCLSFAIRLESYSPLAAKSYRTRLSARKSRLPPFCCASN